MPVEILGMVMAGGKGERLYPLTEVRSKPAVPFGGKFRLIDFVLSNLINSGVSAIYILTQYKAQSLIEHLQRGWTISDIRGRGFIIPVPAQMRTGEMWYQGTADAIFQNLNLIENNRPTYVAVFGADHVYRMDVRQMVDFHRRMGADATVATIPVPIEQANQFGVIEVDRNWRIVGFHEKPENPIPIPGRPDMVLASMGNYLFNTRFLHNVLIEDATRSSDHDFGKSILPRVYDSSAIYAYDFSRNIVPGAGVAERGYWRDVGTLDAYYTANMDLCAVEPVFNLYNRDWPLHTTDYDDPPVKFVFDDEDRMGVALNSIVSVGSIISGGRVSGSVLGRGVFVHSYSEVEDSILMDEVEVGRHARVRRAIIDKNVRIPPGEEIGFDPVKDAERFRIDPVSGLVVIPKAAPGF